MAFNASTESLSEVSTLDTDAEHETRFNAGTFMLGIQEYEFPLTV